MIIVVKRPQRLSKPAHPGLSLRHQATNHARLAIALFLSARIASHLIERSFSVNVQTGCHGAILSSPWQVAVREADCCVIEGHRKTENQNLFKHLLGMTVTNSYQ